MIKRVVLSLILFVSLSDIEAETIPLVLNHLKQSYNDEVSIIYTDLSTLSSYELNANIPMNPASTIKVLVMIEAFEQIKNNLIKLTDKVKLLDGDKIKGSGNTYYEKTGEIISIEKCLQTMIIGSDNTTTKILIDVLGKDNINRLARRLRLISTEINTSDLLNKQQLNKSSANDIAEVFKFIYRKYKQDDPYATIMINYLFNQNYKWGIPYKLPGGVQVANKTGSLKNYKHDCGIVFLENHDYVLCVFTKDIDRKKAENLISNVSEKIYKTLHQK